VKRRGGKGTGTVFYDRRRGRWVAQLTVGHDPATGLPRKITRVFPTRKEAEAWRVEQAARLHKGLLGSPEAITVREWASRWLEGKAQEVRPRTLALYLQDLGHAIPSLKDPKTPDPFGSLRLQAVQPSHIRGVLEGLKGRYSLRTVRAVRQRLHQVFEEALALEVIARNPVDPVKVRAPKGEGQGKAARALEPHEVSAFLKALDHHKDPRTALALRLCLACGLRRGEVLGLKWEDLDLEAGILTVRRAWTENGKELLLTAPKTAKGRRTVPIPHQTLQRVKAYREMWLRQGFSPEELQGRWVFPNLEADGSRPIHPHSLNKALERIRKALGLPHFRLHDLRHTYGSFLLANGAPVELVSERMGHANPNITLAVYRHLLEEERRGWVLDPEDVAGPRGEA